MGSPPGDDFADAMPPYAFVRNSIGGFETITNVGSIASNAIKAIQHTFHYDIVVVVNQPDSRLAEIELDNYQKLILQTLEADHTLSANVDGSLPIRVEHYDVARRNAGYSGRVMTIRCVKTTG